MNTDEIIKFLSYGMTRFQICDYYGVDEPTLAEFVETNIGQPLTQLEKHYKVNIEFSVMMNLNQQMTNPKILMYMADRVLGPVERDAKVTIVNDVHEDN